MIRIRLTLEWSIVAIAVTFVGSLICASTANAQTTYCDKVESRASADADILLFPTIIAQGYRIPSTPIPDANEFGRTYQPRIGMAVSPLDIYRGTQVMRVGRADCLRQKATMAIQEILQQGADYGRLGPLRLQAEYLRGQDDTVQRVLHLGEARFAAKVITFMELTDLRMRASEIERTLAQVQGELTRLEHHHFRENAEFDSLMKDYLRDAMEYERRDTHVRSLQPWTFRVSAGLAPDSNQQATWFGLVEVTYNTGSTPRNIADTHYLEAREHEIKTARYELVQQLTIFRNDLLDRCDAAKGELEVVDRQIGSIEKERALVEPSEAPLKIHVLAILQLEAISLQAQRIYLTSLIAKLSTLREEVHDGG